MCASSRTWWPRNMEGVVQDVNERKCISKQPHVVGPRVWEESLSSPTAACAWARISQLCWHTRHAEVSASWIASGISREDLLLYVRRQHRGCRVLADGPACRAAWDMTCASADECAYVALFYPAIFFTVMRSASLFARDECFTGLLHDHHKQGRKCVRAPLSSRFLFLFLFSATPLLVHSSLISFTSEPTIPLCRGRPLLHRASRKERSASSRSTHHQHPDQRHLQPDTTTLTSRSYTPRPHNPRPRPRMIT